MLSTYVRSFKVKSVFWYTLAVDALVWGIIIFLLMWLGQQVTREALVLTGGRSGAEFQHYVLALQPEQLEQFTIGLKTFVVRLLLGVVLIPLFSLGIFSFGQSVIWHLLIEKPFRMHRFWKWITLNLELCLFFGVLLGLFFFVRIILVFIDNPSIRGMLHLALLLGLVTHFLLFTSFCYGTFIRTQLIGRSIRDGFRRIYSRESTSFSGFAFLVFAFVQVLQYPLFEFLYVHPWVSTSLQAGLFLLWMSWYRYATYMRFLHGEQ